MYREEILDHYKRPRNEGKLKDASTGARENESCGDSVKIYVNTENGRIQQMTHESEACAICTAATSMLSEETSGKKVSEVRDLGEDYMLELLEIDISPMRYDCAVLSLRALKDALD